MKYKTFRNLIFGGLLLIIGYQSYNLYQEDKDLQRELRLGPPDENPPVPPVPVAPMSQEQMPGGAGQPGLAGGAPGTNPSSGEGLRPVDREILSQLGQPATAEKVKDAIPGPVKVNLYHDDKSGYYNRLKLDLDRDDKWDEKWTMAAGKVLKRQVAPADDEQYSLEFTLEGEGWMKQP